MKDLEAVLSDGAALIRIVALGVPHIPTAFARHIEDCHVVLHKLRAEIDRVAGQRHAEWASSERIAKTLAQAWLDIARLRADNAELEAALAGEREAHRVSVDGENAATDREAALHDALDYIADGNCLSVAAAELRAKEALTAWDRARRTALAAMPARDKSTPIAAPPPAPTSCASCGAAGGSECATWCNARASDAEVRP